MRIGYAGSPGIHVEGLCETQRILIFSLYFTVKLCKRWGMSFDEVLKSMRKRRGLTQEQAAICLGVSTPTLSSWETGKVLPPPVTQRGAWALLRQVPTCDPADAKLDEVEPLMFEK